MVYGTERYTDVLVHLHLISAPLLPRSVVVVVGDGIWHREIYRCTPKARICPHSPESGGREGGIWHRELVQMYTYS